MGYTLLPYLSHSGFLCNPSQKSPLSCNLVKKVEQETKCDGLPLFEYLKDVLVLAFVTAVMIALTLIFFSVLRK